MIGNEQLKALEAHMLRLSKQAQGEHELTGNEDPSILHAYISYLPSRLAYKEGMLMYHLDIVNMFCDMRFH